MSVRLWFAFVLVFEFEFMFVNCLFVCERVSVS